MVLRPGNVPATAGARDVLRRLLARRRRAFPQVRFLVRLDGGDASPEMLDFLDDEPRLDDVVAMADNPVLTRLAAAAMTEARHRSDGSGQTEHVDLDAAYAAQSWRATGGAS